VIRRVLILVEGQTEEAFVNRLLQDYFADSLSIAATILVTRHVKAGASFRGGVTNFDHFKNDLQRLLRQPSDALVTTMLDYYGLPDDFPGMSDRPKGAAIGRVKHVEAAIHHYFGSPKRFLPYLSLHEFEALLFSAPDVLPRIMTLPDQAMKFAAIRTQFRTPEDIDEGPNTAPSKRILALFPGYRKTLHGPQICKEIGVSQLCGECPHFRNWISQLECYARST
jgi:hypothetical protein